MPTFCTVLGMIWLWLGVASAVAGDAKPHPIVWDAMEKTSEPNPGDGAAAFVFKATNTSDQPVTIVAVRPSCTCTTVDLPATPWVLAPGQSGTLMATVDFSGKDGVLTKALFVESPAGAQMLIVHVKIPPLDAAARERNQKAALVNRQRVFQGDCAACHATPAAGKTGEDLFQVACGICHASARRAGMVPDLLVARESRTADWWRKWIGEGREGTLMPGFAGKSGGPLSDAQIESLVQFAMTHLPTQPTKN